MAISPEESGTHPEPGRQFLGECGALTVALRAKARHEQVSGHALLGLGAIPGRGSAVHAVQNIVCLENIQDFLLDDASLSQLPGSQGGGHGIQRAAGRNDFWTYGAIQQRRLHHQEAR